MIILLFTLNNNTAVSETEHIVYEQPTINTQVEQEEDPKEYTEEIIYVQEEENESEDEQQSTEQAKEAVETLSGTASNLIKVIILLIGVLFAMRVMIDFLRGGY